MVLPAPHGKHDDTGAAVPEALDRFELVGPDRPAVLVQRDRMRLAIDVTGEVFGRPAELEQYLLEVTSLARMNDDSVVIKTDADHGRNLRAAQHFLEDRAIDRTQHEPVRGIVGELQPPVAGHRLGDVDQQRVRHCVAAVLQQRVDDFFCIVAGGPRVPQAERGEAIRVDVLRRTFEFGERCDRPPTLRGEVVLNLEEKRLVRLDDQWSVGH